MSLTTVDAGLLSNNAQQVGFKNRIIDGGFILNQRGYVSGVSLASGTYGHDRWKGGASAGTYTFTQGALGVNTTITITAGSLIQVIEGCNVAEGGTYVLSWTGTAQGRLNGGTYGASGTVTVTGWTAGTNLNVEFNTGTCGSVQLEKGSTATSFDYRPYGTELALCQRYFQQFGGTATYEYIGDAIAFSTTGAYAGISLLVPMRTAPSFAFTGAANNFTLDGGNNNYQITSNLVINSGTSTQKARLGVSYSAGTITTSQYYTLLTYSTSTGKLQFSAEL